MRIQILAINYSPERTGIAPYATALARHLSERHDVIVITGLPHYPDWRVSPEHRCWRREERDGDVRVVRLSHYVPRSPSAVGRAAYEVTWAARAAIAGLRIPTDVVIAVVPALLGAHAARLIARRNGARVGLAVQDVMGAAAAQSGYRGGRVVARLTTHVERSALRNVDAITTIHPKLADELARISEHSLVPTVIYNWTHVRRRPDRPDRSLRSRFGWPDDEIIALHSGNMGSKQNLEVVIDAARLAETQGQMVRFVLAGDGSQRRKLERYGAGCTRLQFIDSVGDEEYMDMLAAADVLVVNERAGMRQMSLPSKLTSYLAARRPIVAATDRDSATDEFIRRSGGGIVTPAGVPGALLHAVMKIAAQPQLAAGLSEAGGAFADEHLSPAAAMSAYDAWVTNLGPELGLDRSCTLTTRTT